jgi:hypothetical protein
VALRLKAQGGANTLSSVASALAPNTLSSVASALAPSTLSEGGDTVFILQRERSSLRLIGTTPISRSLGKISLHRMQ